MPPKKTKGKKASPTYIIIQADTKSKSGKDKSGNGKKDPKNKKNKKDKKKKQAKKNPPYKEVIQKSLQFMCESITNIQRLLIHLIAKEVLSIDEEQEIMSYPVESKKCLVLMQIFYRKDKRAFNTLKTALIETLNQNVARQLEQLEAKEIADRQALGINENGFNKEDAKENRRKLAQRKQTESEEEAEEEDESESDSDDEEDENDIEPTFDLDDDSPEVSTLTDVFCAVGNYLGSVNYFPQQEYAVYRFLDFKRGENIRSAETMTRYGLAMKRQRFMVDRPIFLTKVGFYGPATTPITSYIVSVNLTQVIGFQIGCCRSPNILGESEQVVEVAHGDILFMPFSWPIAIKPHVWYEINFSIKGYADIIVRKPGAKLETAHIHCEEHGLVRFDFSTGSSDSSCQLPILCFYKGKPRLLPTLFPSTTEEGAKYKDQEQILKWLAKEEIVRQQQQAKGQKYRSPDLPGFQRYQ